MENTTFKYKLDNSSKKYVCPKCNKKTFVYYLDSETGNYLNADYGRCDREQNCNYHKAPPKGKIAYLIDVLALEAISDKAYKLTEKSGFISIVPKSQILEQTNFSCWITDWFLQSSAIDYLGSESKYFNTEEINFINEVRPLADIEHPEASYHTLELLDKLYAENPTEDNLTKYLLTIFTAKEVEEAMQNYLITGTDYFWKNSTVFWQIDNNEKIHSGKIMKYDSVTGRRLKQPFSHINWMHKALNETEFNLCQCLFGLHRIDEDTQKTIGICESEKTAIILSIFLPDFIWLATGSKSNFKFDLLKPLKNRNVIAYPDKGEYLNWLSKSQELKALGYNIAISDLIEKTDFENGFDLADYYFKMHEMHEMKRKQNILFSH